MEFLTSAPIMTEYADFSRLFHTRLDINPFEGEPLMEAFAKTQRNYMRFPTSLRLLGHVHARGGRRRSSARSRPRMH